MRVLSVTSPMALKIDRPRFGQRSVPSSLAQDWGGQMVQELSQHPGHPSLALAHYLALLNQPSVPADQKQASLKAVLTQVFPKTKQNNAENKARLHVASLLVAHVIQYSTYFDAAVRSSVANICQGLSHPAISYLYTLSQPHSKTANDPWFKVLEVQNNRKNPYWLSQTVVSMLEEAHDAMDETDRQNTIEAVNMLCTHVDQFGTADAILEALQRCDSVQLSPHIVNYLQQVHNRPGDISQWLPGRGQSR